MCFRKIFGHSNPAPIPVTGNFTVFSYGINDYPGNSNDLRGCINDTKNIKTFFEGNYPKFVSTLWSDSAVKRDAFLTSCTNQIVQMKPEDWFVIHYSGHGSYGVRPGHTEADGYSECMYLYDNPVWDYEVIDMLDKVPEGAHVILILDSCFSGGMFSTKSMSNPGKEIRNKYMPFPGLEIKSHIPKRKSILRTGGKGWAVMAGCQESQTCADTVEDNQPCGAYTHYLIKSWNDKLASFGKWNDACDVAIAAPGEYDQVPTIGGNIEIINHCIFC